MAKKNESTPQREVVPVPKKSKKKLILTITLIILLAGLGGGAWYGYTTYMKTAFPRAAFDAVDLDEAVLKFTWKTLPGVYDRLSELNSEITLIEVELKRIGGVGKKYPRQQKIVIAETKRWNRTLKRLKTQVDKFQKQIESLYVMVKVNGEKGESAIIEKSPALLESMAQAVDSIQAQTMAIKLAKPEPQGFVEEAKAKAMELLGKS